MNLDLLREESKEDLAVDKLRIEESAANNPMLYGKWLDYLMQGKYDRLRINNQLKRISMDRLLYYTGKHEKDVSPTVYDRQELKTVMAADTAVMKANTELELCELKIQLCEETLKAINSRQFTIKNIIDVRKLEAGI